MHTYYFDIEKKVVLSDCNLHPTEVGETDAYWLYARNNKYPGDSINTSKIGKWMIFLPKNTIDATWAKIKLAVASGDLWHSKVSTSKETNCTHAIMIYTRDYSDLTDVIQVLDFLETSGIKPANTVIYYKTDQQTCANIYSGHGKKASMYSSNTVRNINLSESSPTKVSKNDPCWLYARNDKHTYDPSTIGKWMLFCAKDTVDEIWEKIEMAVECHDLWYAKVSPPTETYDTQAIMIYTKDYSDLNDVIEVLDFLETSGIKPSDTVIYYKTCQQTSAGVYSAHGNKASIYSSNTIRSMI